MITNQPRSDPGDNLDLTRNTPIWAMVEWWDSSSMETPPTPPYQGGAKEQLPPLTKGGLGGVNFLKLFLLKEAKELAMIKRPEKQRSIVMQRTYY